MCVCVCVCTDCIHENSADKTNLTASQPCFCRHVSSSSSRKDSLCSPLLAHSFFFLSFLSFLTSPVTSAHHRPPVRPPASRLPSSSSFSAVKFACCNWRVRPDAVLRPSGRDSSHYKSAFVRSFDLPPPPPLRVHRAPSYNWSYFFSPTSPRDSQRLSTAFY